VIGIRELGEGERQQAAVYGNLMSAVFLTPGSWPPAVSLQELIHQLETFKVRVGTIKTQLVIFKVQVATFKVQVATLQVQLASFKVQVATFQV